MTTSSGNDGLQSGHGGVSVDGAIHPVRQGLPGELIDHVENLDDPPGGGDVELEVQRPHVVRAGGGQAVGGRG